MRVLRFIWRGVLAFDRIGSRIPQLVQIWLIEFFFALPLAFFIAKLIDIRGASDVPGTGESMPGVFWGALVVSLVCGFYFFRSLNRPRSCCLPRRSRRWLVAMTTNHGDSTFYWRVAGVRRVRNPLNKRIGSYRGNLSPAMGRVHRARVMFGMSTSTYVGTFVGGTGWSSTKTPAVWPLGILRSSGLMQAPLRITPPACSQQ
jgi:hypothetical protein